MKWQQITVRTTSAFSDDVSYILIELGSEGTAIKDSREIAEVIKNHNWDYIDKSLEKIEDIGEALVSGFFPVDFSVEKLVETLNEYKTFSAVNTGSLELFSSVIDSTDWENEWRKYYRPIEIGNVVIVPKWYKYENTKNLIEVMLEPGMAFGTGSHETTSMCVRLLQEIELKGKTTADVGCGSGILGISALKLDATNCAFVDIDEQAVKATNDNLSINNVESNRANVYLGNLLDFTSGEFDVVIANITADILLMLKNDLVKSLKSGGKLIISGLINARADEVKQEYEKDYTVLKNLKEGEWQAFLLMKN